MNCLPLALTVVSLVAATVVPARADEANVSARVTGVESCPTSDAPKRRCLRLRVTVGASGRSETEATFIADERLEKSVRDRFGSRSGPVFDALVAPIGRARTKGRYKREAAHAVQALVDAGAARFYTLGDDVSLNSASEAKVSRIAARYFAVTGQILYITSGTRDARSQAEAMVDKLRYGGSLSLYRDRAAARAIRDAIRQARKAGKGRAEMVAAAQRLIEEQMRRGIFISRHLQSGAIDVRSIGMSGKARSAFKRAALAEPGVKVLYERRPPHFHVTL
jgi:hypothetical protein